MTTALIILALLVSGGVGLGAEQSKPGDTLYPVKVEISEKVRGAFKFNTENDAQWKASLTERRLSEAEHLALKGELSAEAMVELQNRLDAHMEAYETLIDRLEDKENYQAIAEVSSRFESSLRAHRAIMVQIAAQVTGDTQVQLQNLIKEVDEKIVAVAAVRTEAEAKIDSNLDDDNVNVGTIASIEARLDVAENHISNLTRFVENKAQYLSASAEAEIKARLVVAAADLKEARAQFEAKAYTKTQSLIRKIEDTVNETRTMVTAQATLGLGLKTNDNKEDDNNEDNRREIKVDLDSKTKIDADKEIKTNNSEKIKVDIGL